MKKTIIALSAIFGLFLGTSALAELKVGVINAQKVFMDSPQMAAAKVAFKKKFEGREKEVNTLQKDLQKAVDDFNKNGSTMKAEDQKKEQQKIAEQHKKLQELQSKLQSDANAAQEKVMKEFSEKFEAAVNKVATEKGLDLVVAKASLAYSKPGLEITDEVLKAIKK